MAIRLVIALLLGGIIGIEREYRSKDAGFRTHFLVAMGSALFTIISQYGFSEALKDSSRVAAQVVSGIGFLGAGIIIFQKNMVRGLTTAAGLWVTAAIGMACGTGMYLVAAVTTALVLFGLEVLHFMIPQVGTTVVQLSFNAPSKESARSVLRNLQGDSLDIISYHQERIHTGKTDTYSTVMEIKMK
nr:MgtC/SapB family protein [Prevotella illustrans]